MNAYLLDPGDSAGCEPVTCTRPLGECPVGNRPLAEVQKERLAAAGFSPRSGEAGAGIALRVKRGLGGGRFFIY